MKLPERRLKSCSILNSVQESAIFVSPCVRWHFALQINKIGGTHLLHTGLHKRSHMLFKYIYAKKFKRKQLEILGIIRRMNDHSSKSLAIRLSNGHDKITVSVKACAVSEDATAFVLSESMLSVASREAVPRSESPEKKFTINKSNLTKFNSTHWIINRRWSSSNVALAERVL